MAKDFRRTMRIGIVQFMAYPTTMSGNGPILESIDDLIQDDFYDVLELTHIEDQSVRKETAERIHMSGMDIAFGSQPLILGQQLNLHNRDGDTRRTAIDIIKDALNEAVEIGSVGFALMSGIDPGEEHREEETKLFVESLREICTRAHELNPDLNVVVETFDRVPFGKNCLFGPTHEAVAMINEVRRDFPQVGLMLDLSHLPLLDETPEYAISQAAPVLLHTHVGNCVMKDSANPYYGDNHPPFDYPGSENSQVDLVRYLKSLDNVGYLSADNPPILTIEVKPLSDSLRPATLGNVKRTLKRAIAELNEME